MWNPFKKTGNKCGMLQESLEETGGYEALPATLRQHALKCEACQAAASDLETSSALLRDFARTAPVNPWFASRVMAAIATRESELRRSIDAWTVVPKLARRLSWMSALALVLAGTWLLGQPATKPSKPVVTDITGEPLPESASPVNNDEMLLSLAEQGS